MVHVLAAKHAADAQELGFHPNTRAPTNWDHVGNLAKPLSNGGPWNFAGLTPGPEQWHVYSTMVPIGRRVVRIATDALGRPIPSSKVWRKGHEGHPHDLQTWVKGPKGNIYTADSVAALAEENAYQARRDRVDPVRIAAVRDQRRQERQAQLAQRRAERRQRLLADRAARRAVQQAARQANAVPNAAPNATETTVAQGIANVMQAVHSLVRPLRPSPDAAAEPNPAPVAAAAAPVLDLAAAWSVLQEQVPRLLQAQAAQAAQAEHASRTVTCVICMDAMPEMAFTECGHAVSCKSCTDRLEGWGSLSGHSRRKCPVCRTSGSVIRIHFG